MKVLVVSGGDFSAQEFENEHGGKAVSEIISDISSFESDEWELEVKEFGDIDPAFVDYLKKDVIDYDMNKSTSFYLEGTLVP